MSFDELLARGLQAAERFEVIAEKVEAVASIGPVGLGFLAWQALPGETRERISGNVCADCGEPRSLCQCCALCGYTPCACPERFEPVIDTQGEAL